MKPEDRDDALLWDMLEHARIVRSIVSQTVYFRYINDRTLQLAVERAIEIVG